eukprot:GSChrysophyteH2.ASY1.ANO1.1373.1 assembled CDS
MSSSLEGLRRNGVVKDHVPANMLEKCAALADKYCIEVKRFAAHLDAYLINQEISILSQDQMGKFDQFLLVENKKYSANKPPLPPQHKDGQGASAAKRPFEAQTKEETPAKSAKSSSASSPEAFSQNSLGGTPGSQGGEAYENRKGKGDPVLNNPANASLGVRGEVEPSDLQPLGLRSRISTDDAEFDNCKERYRYMFTTADQRAAELERQLLRMRKHMCDKAKLAVGDLQPLGMPSPDVVWVCGRVVCDASEGRINKQSVMLEGSRREARYLVKLDLTDLSAYSLFPGQVVLVEGVNASGRVMVAKRLVEGFPADCPTTTPERLLEYHHSTMFQGGQALKVVTAAGPFTTSDSLRYDPLLDLLRLVLTQKPDVLLLVGPFVDVTQPLLAGGDVMIKIRGALEALFNSEADYGTIATNIILVPSLNDAHHECVFPQPPFGDRDRNDIRKRVHLMPNPCMFRVNEVLFGVTSCDALFSLSSDEVSQNIGTNRLDRLAAHLLQQQSFAPQFPAPANVTAQLDLRHAKHWHMKTSPDVLIVPSKLAYMAREVVGTLVVNPGHLTKGSNGGTYAELNIHPMDEKVLRDKLLGADKDTPLKHGVSARTYANIMKI